ncbi:hypothetical protein ACLOJK_026458, partial [Asimina triloba]
ATAAREEAFRFSIKLVSFKFEADALHARGADPNVNGEKSHVEHEVARGEVSMLQEEAEFLVESEVARVEVAQLRSELETSWDDLKHLQVASS